MSKSIGPNKIVGEIMIVIIGNKSELTTTPIVREVLKS
jgi:hypothetical protein